MTFKGLGSPAGQEPKSESLFFGVHIRSFPPLTENGVLPAETCSSRKTGLSVTSTYAEPNRQFTTGLASHGPVHDLRAARHRVHDKTSPHSDHSASARKPIHATSSILPLPALSSIQNGSSSPIRQDAVYLALSIQLAVSKGVPGSRIFSNVESGVLAWSILCSTF
jgi:hypothetical protein